MESAAALKSGALSAEDLTRACLARIEAREPQVRAFAYLDPEHALAQARAADERLRSGASLGTLHGLPVGVKDIFDTADMPTENGSRAHAGRRPASDSAVVERLRAAGAIVLGKTVTTEFAGFAPGATRNPHDLERTPGGSSSGSAAAVAAGMVPLAIGSQTAGSVIRPGSFCGVIAFKPQFGAISRHGCTLLARALDHVGLYARAVEDIALLASALYGPDPRDPDAGTVEADALTACTFDTEGLTPRLAFAPTAFWERADADTRTAFDTLVGPDRLNLPRLELPTPFAQALDWLNAICQAEMALEFDLLAQEHGDALRPQTLEEIRSHPPGHRIRLPQGSAWSGGAARPARRAASRGRCAGDAGRDRRSAWPRIDRRSGVLLDLDAGRAPRDQRAVAARSQWIAARSAAHRSTRRGRRTTAYCPLAAPGLTRRTPTEDIIMAELAYKSVSELIAGFRAKRFTPLDVLEAVFARIEHLQPTLNAYQLLDASRARRSARASTKRWAKGQPQGLVDGVPGRDQRRDRDQGLADLERIAGDRSERALAGGCHRGGALSRPRRGDRRQDRDPGIRLEGHHR